MPSKLIVQHQSYGCETGCCGHVVLLDGVQQSSFEFGDADSIESKRKYAEQLVTEKMGAEHVKDLDWDNSYVLSYDEDH